ncbi:uncharacterized protein [Narcine bancroftii]|uniref:uncharacterized protein n=1 Tax=Narcine bancroftii TaxID=1343680 RepID=UPI0038313716
MLTSKPILPRQSPHHHFSPCGNSNSCPTSAPSPVQLAVYSNSPSYPLTSPVPALHRRTLQSPYCTLAVQDPVFSCWTYQPLFTHAGRSSTVSCSRPAIGMLPAQPPSPQQVYPTNLSPGSSSCSRSPSLVHPAPVVSRWSLQPRCCSSPADPMLTAQLTSAAQFAPNNLPPGGSSSSRLHRRPQQSPFSLVAALAPIFLRRPLQTEFFPSSRPSPVFSRWPPLTLFFPAVHSSPRSPLPVARAPFSCSSPAVPMLSAQSPSPPSFAPTLFSPAGRSSSPSPPLTAPVTFSSTVFSRPRSLPLATAAPVLL